MFISKSALKRITDRLALIEESQRVQKFEQKYPNGRVTMRGRNSFAPEQVYEYSYGGKIRQVGLPIPVDSCFKLRNVSADEESVVLWVEVGDCTMKCYCFSHGSPFATEVDADAILKTKPEE